MLTRHLLFGLLIGVVHTIAAHSLHAAEITIKGSDTMVVLNQKWAQEYMKKHPDVNIQITGGGSGTGIAALRNKTTDIAAASRLIKPKEIQDFLVNAGIKPVLYKACLDGVAVFVNAANPINEISLPTLSKIYRGEITNWKQVGGPDQSIVLYSRESNSGTYAYFKEEVLLEKDYSPRAQTLAGTAALIDAIAKDTKGIGYGGIGYTHGVKPLKLRRTDSDVAVAPTKANVESGAYPLSRSLNFYINPRSTGPEIQKFIKWVRSAEGQKIVALVGYYPLPGVLPKSVTTSPTSTKPRPTLVTKPATAPEVSAEPPATPPPQPPANSEPAGATTTLEEKKAQEPQPPAAETMMPAANRPESNSAPAETRNTLTEPTGQSGTPIHPANQLGQMRSILTERERSVKLREEAVAKREETVGRRELAVGDREAFLTTREEKLTSEPVMPK